MRLNTRTIIPLVFIILSLLYLVFSFSLEQRRMIGDERGWDPGSRAMPIGIGILMLGLSIYLFVKERQVKEEEARPLSLGNKKIIVLTIMLSTLYIFFFRFVGFILSTSILLFTLIFFNYKKDIRIYMLPNFSLGMLFSTVLILVHYSIGRFITRSLLLTGKRLSIELLTGMFFITSITLLILAGIYLLALFIAKKLAKTEKAKRLLMSIFVATGVTEFIYLVFKQIFFVSLAKGIIFW